MRFRCERFRDKMAIVTSAALVNHIQISRESWNPRENMTKSEGWVLGQQTA